MDRASSEHALHDRDRIAVVVGNNVWSGDELSAFSVPTVVADNVADVVVVAGLERTFCAEAKLARGCLFVWRMDAEETTCRAGCLTLLLLLLVADVVGCGRCLARRVAIATRLGGGHHLAMHVAGVVFSLRGDKRR